MCSVVPLLCLCAAWACHGMTFPFYEFEDEGGHIL